jgi:membrane protease YdiL (CAAX protease family)
MKIEKYRHPFIFYSIAVLVPWALWFICAGISHSVLWDNPAWVTFGSLLGLLGLLAPMIIAFILILPDKEMRDELISACTNFKDVKLKWWAFTFLFPFAVILLAQAISLLFGYSTEQFKFVEKFSFSAGIFPAWFMMILAPIFEEFGWHTYGTHCVRRRFNLFTTCFIFGLIWGIWHMPLSFIKDYYQNVLMRTGVIYSINFIVSVIPYLIIDNWQYYKVKRNMGLQIGQHFTFGYSMEIFRTHPDSKLIHTLLLCIFCVVIVIKDRKFFFDKAFDSQI